MVKVTHQDAIIHPDDLKVLVRMILAEHDQTKRKVEAIMECYLLSAEQKPIVADAVQKAIEAKGRRRG